MVTCFHEAGASGKYFVSGSSRLNLAFFDQHHHGSCGELFTHRTGLKNCFWLDRNL